MRNDGRLHFSQLKLIGQSPMHFRYGCDNEQEDTDSFLIGRAVHAKVLQGIEPATWDGRRAGKDYQLAVDANDGEPLLSTSQGETVNGIATAVAKSRLAQDILRRCPEREQYLTWERSGEECGGTLDAFGPSTLVELKTTKSAHPFRFANEVTWYRYAEQLAWYLRALGDKFDQDTQPERDAYIIAVEKKAPFAVSVHRLMPLRLLQADARCSEWLKRYQECKRMGYWPGWDESANEIFGEPEYSSEEEEE